MGLDKIKTFKEEMMMIYEKFEDIPFQGRAKERLRQIYSVLYYMNKMYDYKDAVKKAVEDFPSVNDRSTISSKCATQFAGDKKTFVKWYETGKMLEMLVQKNKLDEHDEKIFSELLNVSAKKEIASDSDENREENLSKEKKEVLYLWKKVLEKQSSGVEFKTIKRYNQIQQMKKDAEIFVKNPSEENFRKFWNGERLYAAKMKANSTQVWESNNPEKLRKLISNMLESKEFKEDWENMIKNARRVLWELFGIFHIEDIPTLNKCPENGLKFFGFKGKSTYKSLLENFERFKKIYLKEIGYVTKGLEYELPINLEVDQLLNVVDKTDEKSLDDAKTREEKELYRKIIELKNNSEKAKNEKDVRNETMLNDENSINYFWITSNPKIWNVSRIKDGGSVLYSAYNKKMNKRRIFNAFKKARSGDKVLFYESTPIKKIVALGEITEGLHIEKEGGFEEPVQGIRIKYIRDITPIDWFTLESVEELKESAPIRNGAQGSIFELTKEEYEAILALEEVEAEVKEHWKDIKEKLKYDLDKDFEIKAPLFFPKDMKKTLEKRISTAIKAGKHMILIGPPGTGKSKLAKSIAEQYVGEENYIMSTANSDWSTFDTIGGYFPKKDDDNNESLEFKPGIFLKCFRDEEENPVNKWLIIDEINRADIDKAFGSLFSALTGDDITLSFERNGEPINVIGNPKDDINIKNSKFIIPSDWRIIATMNTFDKSSLYEMSYAFMRRFAFIPVDVPKDISEDNLRGYLRVWNNEGGEVSETTVKTLTELWKQVNKTRKIGPAIVEDIYEYIKYMPENYASAIILFVLPQFEGLPDEKIIDFVKSLKGMESVKEEPIKEFCSDFFGIELDKLEGTEK